MPSEEEGRNYVSEQPIDHFGHLEESYKAKNLKIEIPDTPLDANRSNSEEQDYKASIESAIASAIIDKYLNEKLEKKQPDKNTPD